MNLFPDLSISARLEDENNLPVYAEWAYDFDNNCLRTRNGAYYLVYKDEALKVWIFKALRTPRYRYQAYPREFGQELELAIGTGESQLIKDNEIEQFIQEALIVNPYIKTVTEFEFEHTGSRNQVTFTVQTVYGDIQEAYEYYE